MSLFDTSRVSQYPHEYGCLSVNHNLPHLFHGNLGHIHHFQTRPEHHIELVIYSMVISGTYSLEVPTVYKAYDSYVSGLFFREYPHKISPYMVQYGTNVAPFEDPEDLPLIYPIPSKSLCQGGTKSRSPRTRVIPRWQEAPRLFRIVFF